MDRLELGVDQCCVREHRDVVTGRELDQVVDQPGDPVGVRGYEACTVRDDVGTPDPDVLGTPAPCDVGIRVVEKGLVRREDAL